MCPTPFPYNTDIMTDVQNGYKIKCLESNRRDLIFSAFNISAIISFLGHTDLLLKMNSHTLRAISRSSIMVGGGWVSPK